MNDEATACAADTLEELRWSIEDYSAICDMIRRARQEGWTVDVAKAEATMYACLRDLVESCVSLAKGRESDADMAILTGALAKWIVAHG